MAETARTNRTDHAARRPNLLVIMADEHAPMFSGTYGHPIVRTPNLDRLAARGVLFENAYCNSPLCVPSRMSFMTGRYVHHIAAWDTNSVLPSDAVTWAHLLRAAGYDVVLSGKQHFRGLDQLHGFRAQIARDLHATRPARPTGWDDPPRPADQVRNSLAEAGPGGTEELAADDDVEAAALRYLRDPARHDQPWALNVSFIAPHFPLVAPPRFWEMYPTEGVDLPVIPDGHLDRQHPMYRRLRRFFHFDGFPEELVRRGRAGYYALISYVDDKIGRLLDALDETGQSENTLVLYTSDHGEMAGEHGLWRKSCLYEQAARVPLILSWPAAASGAGLPAGRRVREPVSLVDAVATLLDAADAPAIAPLDGVSLLGLARGTATEPRDEAFCEYFGHGVVRPVALLRRGRYKLTYSLDDPPELYDLEDDPGEFRDLADEPDYRTVREDLRARLLSHWDPVRLERRVRQSQREAQLIYDATQGVGAPSRGGASRGPA